MTDKEKLEKEFPGWIIHRLLRDDGPGVLFMVVDPGSKRFARFEIGENEDVTVMFEDIKKAFQLQ